MSPLEHSRSVNGQHRRWYILAIVLAIAAVTLSLATRASTPRVSHGITAQSQSSNSVRQHLDSDAAGWVPPVAPVMVSEAPSFYPRVSPTGPPLQSLFFEESLYNRPPPSC